MKTNSIWTMLAITMVIILVALAAGVIYSVNSIRQTAEKSIQPIQQANDLLQTQVAQILHPTPTIIPDPITIVHEVRSLARLETIQYTVEKVITAETGQGEFSFLFGDRLLLIAHGQVIAGVDLSKMSTEDLWLEGTTLNIRLPDPEVFVATLDNDKSYVFTRETGVLTRQDQSLESQARQAAENEILKAAINDGILDMARQNAENYLDRLLRKLGYDEIIFVPNIAQTPTP